MTKNTAVFSSEPFYQKDTEDSGIYDYAIIIYPAGAEQGEMHLYFLDMQYAKECFDAIAMMENEMVIAELNYTHYCDESISWICEFPNIIESNA